jgi:hypothetical protein
LSVLLAAAAMGVGCVTEEIAPEDVAVASSSLFVTRSGSDVQLSWQSDADVYYTVMASDRRDGRARWQPLPGATQVRGTGGTMNFADRVPVGRHRYYRLQMARVP